MPRLGVAALLVLALVAVSPMAGAFERQWHVGGGAGVAAFAYPKTQAGPALGAHAAYGLSDTFDLRLAALGSAHRNDGRPFDVGSVTAGIAYKLDVLSWVPYAGLSAGYYHLGRRHRPDPLAADEAGFSVDLGLDYAVRRHFGLGFELRCHGFLSDPFASITDAPFFTGLLRAEYRWGW